MFKEIPANNKSLLMRKNVFGIGVNDANYKVRIRVGNTTFLCPFYRKWQNMLQRCYSYKFHERQPSYKGCSVCGEWLVFSNFKLWMIKQDWKDKELDKDILVQGNKVYHPEKCIFITRRVNCLVNYNDNSRGKYKRGVTFDKVNKKFFSRSPNQEGLKVFLGYFESETEAHKAYLEAKRELILVISKKEKEPLKTALTKLKFT